MDPLIKEFLNCTYCDDDVDIIESEIFRKLGEKAASDDDLLLDCMEYFDRY
jgi:hypothetical protein